MGVVISDFIFNSDFTSEKLIESVKKLEYTISAGSRAHKALIGYVNMTVDSNDYLISAIHSSTKTSVIQCGPYGDYATGASAAGAGYPYFVYGEVIQTSKTNIRLRIWLTVSGGGSAYIPAMTVTARVKLSVLPLKW